MMEEEEASKGNLCQSAIMRKEMSPVRNYLANSPKVQKVRPIFSPGFKSKKVSELTAETHPSQSLDDSPASSLLQQRDRAEEDSFYDSMSGQYVTVNNFAFPEEGNHFEQAANASIDLTERLEKELTLAASEDQIQHCPKILDSPRDLQVPAVPPLKRLSGEIGPEFLPSRSNPGTPRTANNPEETHLSIPADVPTIAAKKSAIPRYVRNPRSKSFSPSPVLRKTKQSNNAFADAAPRCCQVSREKSQSISNLAMSPSLGDGNAAKNSRSDPNLNLVGGKNAFKHVKSKVRQYIEDVKNLSKTKEEKSFQLSPGRKSLSMSNLGSEAQDQGLSNAVAGTNNLNRMKAFISTSNLEDLRVTLKKHTSDGHQQTSTTDLRFDRTRLSRLLDNLSDSDEDPVAEIDQDLTLDVEEVLMLAWEERKEKQEAKKVLSQLQENYDILQRKFADAENRIDKMR